MFHVGNLYTVTLAELMSANTKISPLSLYIYIILFSRKLLTLSL